MNTSKKLFVKTSLQIAELWDGPTKVKSYSISTAQNGLSCEDNTFCTPTGRLRVAKKIGTGEPVGAIFLARIPSGEIWEPGRESVASSQDLVLTRILWLEGTEPQNLNTLGRFIYLHGTNHEDKLGTPASHGCIRFSNFDILEIYESLDVGDDVYIE